jgi:hypothetical protein
MKKGLAWGNNPPEITAKSAPLLPFRFGMGEEKYQRMVFHKRLENHPLVFFNSGLYDYFDLLLI